MSDTDTRMWLGKILGGGLGYAIGGPLGAVLGAVIGHHTLDTGSALTFEEERQGIFFLATFSMLGKLSKADGVVTAEETEVVEQVMLYQLRLAPEARHFAIEIFTAAKSSEDSFDDYAEQFYDEFADRPEALSSLVDLLLRLAHADGVLHPDELQLINRAVAIFGIEAEYEQLKARYSDANNLEQCYDILGVTEKHSLEEIKQQYRKLAMNHHPDRVQSKGMSPELMLSAEERFKEIQHAFDVVERHLAR